MSDIAYVNLWYWGLLIIVGVTTSLSIKDMQKNANMLGALLTMTALLYLMLRPNSHLFADTRTYTANFLNAQKYTNDAYESKDYGFTLLTMLMVPLGSVTLYFGVIASIYLIPVAKALRRAFGNYWYVAMLLFVCSFSFMGYGANGLRNGMATSLLIAAFFAQNKVWRVTLFALAVSMHKSALLPITVFLLTLYYRKPKTYVIAWVLSIPLTILFHGAVENFISTINLDDDADRLGGYMNATFNDEKLFSSMGFRWDFLIYSAIPIALGYYYIVRRHFSDRLYTMLYCVYVGCNTFWLYTIYVPFNNRFAYLSWFLYPIIISYPLFKHEELIPNQHSRVYEMIFLNYMFTLIMFLL